MSKRFFFLWSTVAGIALLTASSVRAQVTESSPLLPPSNGDYESPQQVHAIYPAYQADLIAIQHFGFTNISRVQNGPDVNESFDSVVSGMVSIGGSPYFPVTLSGPVQVTIFGYTPGQTGTFNTQMTSMDVTGTVGPNTAEIITDPNNPSLGQTSIAGTGPYTITSFFDIFTDLNLNSAGFQPSSGPTVVNLVPEPTSLSLLGIGAIGLLARRRRR